MDKFFTRIASVEMLRKGFAKVNANQGTAGGDNMTLEQFWIDLENRLTILNKALVSGGYWPRPVRLVEIPKKSGGVRTLHIPSIQDRVIQTSAALVLTPHLDPMFEDSSFGYRPGRSVQQAVARVDQLRRAGYTWTVDGDIEAFFDSVPHKRLLDRLETALACPRTLDLISRWLDAYCDTNTGLPQGSPISPLLANLYLDEIDEKIEKGGVRLVRFADDFLLLCRSEIAATKARARMAELLREAGLRLHPGKTTVRRFEDSTHFLGHLFVRGMTMEAVAAEPTFPEPEAEAAPPEPRPADRLRWLYVQTPGRVVDRRNMSLTVHDGEGGPELMALQPGWPDAIEIGAAARISDEALRLAMAAGTPVQYLDGDGAVLGRVDPAPDERAALHLAQARHVLDEGLRAQLAGAFVAGRLSNMRAKLYQLNRSRGIETVKKSASQIGRLVKTARIKSTAEGAMAVEARAAKLYWPALAKLIDPVLGFRTRVRQPPGDPVNVVISFLSTRLASDFNVLIARRGLHPGFAHLHATQDGRPSLSLDMMEPYRAALTEGLAIRLFHQKVLDPGQFTRDEGILRASPEAMASIIGAYERAMEERILDKRMGHKTSWRGLMENDILAYARHVRGESPFRAFEMDY